MVGDGLTRESVAERRDMVGSGLNSPARSLRVRASSVQERSPERKSMTTEQDDSWFDPEATTFGDRVAGARELAGMSQKDLARRLGVKLKTLKAWEDDLSEPRANKLSMMAGLLNVSLLWLLSGEGEGPDGPEEQGELSRDVAEMLTEIRDLRAQLALSADRLGRLEKSLRTTLKEEAGV